MAICLIWACSRTEQEQVALPVSFVFGCGAPVTRATDPDMDRISDLNIFIFNENGDLEESRYLTLSQMQTDGNTAICSIMCIRNVDMQVYACANVGFRISGIGNIHDLMNFRYHISYPDEYSRGIPMSGSTGKFKVGKNQEKVIVPMTRLMSRISISVDRSALNKNIRFNVRSVQIGGCPKSASMFRQSKASGRDDIFGQGFMKRYSETDDLNIDARPGISREVDVYMLENMQGVLLPDAMTEEDKVLNISDAISDVCSYIEMKMEYRSDSLFTGPEEYLTYRFYLGSSPADFNVERNCHYHLTVKPIGTGLPESSWRIDKSGLSDYGKSRIQLHPGNYIEGHIGDDVHIWAETDPAGARLTFGQEELEYDKERGIYDFTMDNDGRGVTLHLKNKGSGLVYIEAGAPVNSAEVAVITVN